jgi:hypothetical protein
MSGWKPMICSWYVHEGFNNRAISFNNATRSKMANATAPWQHIAVPMSYPNTHTQQPTLSWAYTDWMVCWMLETSEIIAFLWNDNSFYCASCHFSRLHPGQTVLFQPFVASILFSNELWLIVASFAPINYYSRPTIKVCVRWRKIGACGLSFWKWRYEVNNQPFTLSLTKFAS